MLDELIISAAVGVGRKPPVFAENTGPLGVALKQIAGGAPEAAVLNAVALLSRYQSAGRLPDTASIETLPPAEAETTKPVTKKAEDVLHQILGMTNTPAKASLLNEWCTAADTTQHHAPYRLLPALLDQANFYRGENKTSERNLIAKITGPRGAWLMKQNPKWNFATPTEDDPKVVWATGTREQRLAALQKLRSTDPTGAVALIQSTWAEDAADERSVFIAALRAGLSPSDEPFLETVLDDRSKQVKYAASELLSRLPGSAYVQRMIDRARPLLIFNPSQPGRLLKKAQPASLELTLPAEPFDPAWARDCLLEKPEGTSRGKRQWWLEQLISRVPPAYWSTLWNVTPSEILTASNQTDHTNLLLAAFNEAAVRHPDPKWITVLLARGIADRDQPFTPELLNLLPAEERDASVARLLDSDRDLSTSIQELSKVSREPYGKLAAAALLRQVEKLRVSNDSAAPYLLVIILADASHRLPPELLDSLSDRWTSEGAGYVRKAMDDFFATMSIRRHIQKEFQT